MILYFYIYNLDGKKLTEKAAEVIETPKMYRSADGEMLPGKHVDRIRKSEVGNVNNEYGRISFVSEIQDTTTARAAFVKYCEAHMRRYQNMADLWKKRTSEVESANLSDSDRKERT